MATSAFKSTTKRTSIGGSAEDSASSNQALAHRRSHRVSRFTRRIPAAAGKDFDEAPARAPRGRFINTVKGSGYPETSLDDLVVELFRSGDRGHSGSRNSEASPAIGGSSASQRLGKSVSQQGSKVNGGGDGKVGAGSSSGGGGRLASDNGGSNSRRGRSVSVVPYQISDSEIVFSMLRNYATKLEESEKRKQYLLSEFVLEEQHSRELFKTMKELFLEPRNSVIVDKPSQDGALRRYTDRNRMSKILSEEAERHVDDFISNVEDADISPLDGERNDTSSSSSLGGIMKTQTTQSPPGYVPLPVDMDGVRLPWLQWETSIDASEMYNLPWF